MKNEKALFENGMKEIIKKISCKENLGELSSEEKEYLAECVASEYVAGIMMQRTANGKAVFKMSEPRATRKGLEFLHPKRDNKFIISTVIAVLAIVWAIIQTLIF